MFGRGRAAPKRGRVLPAEMAARIAADGHVRLGSWSVAEIAALGLFERMASASNNPAASSWLQLPADARESAEADGWERLVAAGEAVACPPSTPPKSREALGMLASVAAAFRHYDFFGRVLTGDHENDRTGADSFVTVGIRGAGGGDVVFLAAQLDAPAGRIAVDGWRADALVDAMTGAFAAGNGTGEAVLVVETMRSTPAGPVVQSVTCRRPPGETLSTIQLTQPTTGELPPFPTDEPHLRDVVAALFAAAEG